MITHQQALDILSITEDATRAEVITAYRRLALHHHPDKASHLGEGYQTTHEERMKQINVAKDHIIQNKLYAGEISQGISSAQPVREQRPQHRATRSR